MAILCAIFCTVLDAVVLQRRNGIFSAGFLTQFPLSGPQKVYFVLGSLVVDAAAAVVLSLPVLWLTRRRTPNVRLVVAAFCCNALIFGITIARFDIHEFVGYAMQYRWAPVSSLDPKLLGLGAIVAACIVLGTILIFALRLVPASVTALATRGSQTGKRTVVQGGIVVASAFALMFLTGIVDERMQVQLRLKTTAGWLVGIADDATDFDGDGFGLMRQPTDVAPFDSRFYPYAVDWPDNGLDEDGVAGDLKRRGDFAFENYKPVPFRRRPDVLLIVLESYRADILDAEIDGTPVAPRLRRLVSEGAITGPAYSHNGYTRESLTHLFTGSLTLTLKSSLIDDFTENGYLTACISGEDESFGDIENLTGLARAHYFVDARNDVDQRTSASASPASLTVPWSVVTRNCDRFLEAEGTTEQPVLMYLNFQDCHFPYHHFGIEPILDDRPIPRSEISKETAAWTKRTYLNTAANVDRAVGVILDSWEKKRGKRPAFIIVSDHGESFYEYGVLGHGTRIVPEQVRTLFLMGGFDAPCTFPIGHADVRRILRDSLTSEPALSEAIIDPDRWIFQYVGGIDRPRFVGAGLAEGGLIYDLRAGKQRWWGKTEPRPIEVAHFWEQVRLYRATRKQER
ncbi:MAG: sulfatase-like hydrolase/transferase [Planctomycetota bacterium]